MRGAAVLAWVATVCATSVAADPGALTLAEAIERARTHAPGLKRLAALESAADAGVAAARAERLPSVGVTAGYTRLSSVPELSAPLPGGGSQVIFANLQDNWRARLEGTVPLYTGGKLDAMGDAARAVREAAAGEAAAGDADLVLETTVAYWALATARETERVLREGFAVYDQHLADARNREEQGLVPRSDALLVQVDRDRAELALTRAASAVVVAEEDLRRLVGLPPETAVAIADPLRAPAVPADGTEALFAEALSQRPERAALAARRAALEAAARVEDAARRPRVAAAAGYDYANPNREVLPFESAWKGTWEIGVAATYEFLDGGRSRAAASRARAEAEAAGRRLDEFDERLRVEVVARRRELSAALDAVKVADRAVAAAAEANRILRDRYREGVSTNGDYLDAEEAWLRAGLDRTAALARARVAAAELDRAVGR